MSYLQAETSGNAGSPIELYRFAEGADTWRYCDAGVAQVHASEYYEPMQIGRSEIKVGPAEEDRAVVVALPITAGVVSLWRGAVPERPVAITILRRHQLDMDAQTVAIWKGRVMAAAFLGPRCELSCEHVGASLARIGVRAVYQTTCRHALYGPQCGVNRTSYQVEGVVSAVSGAVVTSDAFADKGDDYFAGGVLSVRGTRRLIVSSTGSTVTLMMPVPGLTVGMALTGYAGCDRTLATCAARFENAEHFGGFPWIPKKNPFSGDAIV